MTTMELALESVSRTESTMGREAFCLSVAAGLHILALLWNPVILKSDFHPAHDFVTVDVVEQGPGSSQPEAPKKMTLMDTLKDMLLKPQADEIAHVAPEPLTHQVAAPLQPALRDRTMPRPIASAFQPQSTAEDLAMARSPDSIQTNPHNLPTLPTNAPVLKSKSFSGIRPQDLPFQVGAGDAISGGSAIPIAVGNASAKTALAYGGPSLKDASGKHPAGISPIGLGSRMADTASLGAGAPSTIELSGTGGTGNAPTGAASGSVLQDRKG